jgi:hypothetical protein
LYVNVVFDLEEAVASGIGILNSLIPYVLARLDLFGVVMQIALGVEIEVNSMVAEC